MNEDKRATSKETMRREKFATGWKFKFGTRWAFRQIERRINRFTRRLESDSTDLLYARKFTLSDVTSYYSQVTISPTANDEGESRSLELVNFMRTVRNLLFIWIWKWKFIIVCLDFE